MDSYVVLPIKTAFIVPGPESDPESADADDDVGALIVWGGRRLVMRAK